MQSTSQFGRRPFTTVGMKPHTIKSQTALANKHTSWKHLLLAVIEFLLGQRSQGICAATGWSTATTLRCLKICDHEVINLVDADRRPIQGPHMNYELMVIAAR